MDFLPAQASPPRRLWDIFCQVIDNHGDIGVCWRLAADLAARGQRVRLWCDDASALAWMAPPATRSRDIELLDWPAQAPGNGGASGGVGDVVIEAFGCEIPPAWAAAIAQAARERPRPPVWINLEYLSAEGYVERCHRLPSPIQSGPAQGLTRWFFYPGFTEHTGGLLREGGLAARQQAFDRQAWRARLGIAPRALAVSLFCYEPPALAELVAQLRQHGPAHLLVAPGRAAQALQRLPAVQDTAGLALHLLPYVSQPQFDEMLWACDLNLVRGEDSLVRALWAGQPLVWNIYPQHDDAHHAKLHAFLDWLDAPASLRRFHLLWNGVQAGAPLPLPSTGVLAEWHACVHAARQSLLQRKDLLTQLLGFVEEKS